MANADLLNEILGLYQKHGWQTRKLLLSPDTLAHLNLALPPAVATEESSIDAIWFSRASHQGREAWELRLLAENPFALFETFEMDEPEEDRDEVRTEMEAKLRDYVTSTSPS